MLSQLQPFFFSRVREVLFTVVTGIALCASPAYSKDLWVNASTGSNASTAGETSNNPCRTIQQALAKVPVSPNETYNIYCTGTFTDSLYINGKGNASADNWIIIKSSGGPSTAKIIPNGWGGRYQDAVQIKNCSRVKVEGFEIKMDRGLASDGSGIALVYSNFISITGNTVHDNGQSGIQAVRCGRLVIEYNQCYNNSFTGYWQGSGISLYQCFDVTGSSATALPSPPSNPRDYQNIVRGNKCWGNENQVNGPGGDHTDGNGIIIDDSRQKQDNDPSDPNPRRYLEQKGGTLVENNLCTANGGRGINVFSSSYVLVINNTCHDNSKDPQIRDGELYHSDSKNVTFRNNIAFARIGLMAIKCFKGDGDAFPIAIENNLFFNGVVADDIGNQAWIPNSNIFGDPRFVNPSTGNYNLLSNSPAIDSASSTNIPPVDTDYVTRAGRGNAYDIGARESSYSRTYPAGTKYYTYIEAESASNQPSFAPFSVGSDSGVSFVSSTSGDQYFNLYQVPLNSTHRAQYTFSNNVNQQVVNIWVRMRRMYWSDGFLFASLDSGGTGERGSMEILRGNDSWNGNGSGYWHWKLYRQVKLTAGTHVFKLIKAVNNTQVDRILVTNDTAYTP